MVATIILDLILFYIVGWIVHFVMGSDGGPLHYCFIGGAGAGLGVLLEWVANRSAGNHVTLDSLLCDCRMGSPKAENQIYEIAQRNRRRQFIT